MNLIVIRCHWHYLKFTLIRIKNTVNKKKSKVKDDCDNNYSLFLFRISVHESSVVGGVVRAVLEIRGVTAADAGSYTCLAANAHGEHSQVYTIAVIGRFGLGFYFLVN